MQITLMQYEDEKLESKITAILEYGKLSIYGYDEYKPSTELPQGSEYEYEVWLDTFSTKQLLDLIAPGKKEDEALHILKSMFQGKGADIRFQAFCFEHEIETNCYSHFDD